MVLIFDLDDTLYSERTFVESGIGAVASFGEREFGWSAPDSYQTMISLLDAQGRGRVFDSWLSEKNMLSQSLVRRCLSVYRSHQPKLSLHESAKRLLPQLVNYPLYIVTDGNKLVQHQKVMALGLQSLFQKIYITHRYGIAKAKPSTYCFELIKKRENCDWQDMLYVGDNPAKDFIQIKNKGIHTVRVLTGEHRSKKVSIEFDAEHMIEDLFSFTDLLYKIEHERKKYLNRQSQNRT